MFSLKYKIAAVIFVIQVLMLGFVIWQTLTQTIESSQKHVYAIETTTLNLVGQSARIALFTEEYDVIQSRIEKLVEDDNILQAFISDHRNIVIASDDLVKLGETPIRVEDSADKYWRKVDIINQSDKLGALFVQFSRHSEQETYQAALQRGIMIGGLGLIVTAILSLVLGTLLTRRLERVVSCVDEVTNGNFHARSNISGKDEVARLGVAFDAMITQVESERNMMFDVNRELEKRVKERTEHLEAALEENKAFSYSVSHDLRAPIRRVSSYLQILQEDYGDKLDDEAVNIIARVIHNNNEMNQLIDSLLELSQASRKTLSKEWIDLSVLAENVIGNLKEFDKERNVDVSIIPEMSVYGDKNMIERVIENLVGNAWKYTLHTESAKIEIGIVNDGTTTYYCKDNGAGFNQDYADKLFSPFQRLHSEEEFSGTGIGLSTVKRIIQRHGGKIWANGEPGKGATFYFTLPRDESEKSHAA